MVDLIPFKTLHSSSPRGRWRGWESAWVAFKSRRFNLESFHEGPKVSDKLLTFFVWTDFLSPLLATLGIFRIFLRFFLERRRLRSKNLRSVEIFSVRASTPGNESEKASAHNDNLGKIQKDLYFNLQLYLMDVILIKYDFS